MVHYNKACTHIVEQGSRRRAVIKLRPQDGCGDTHQVVAAIIPPAGDGFRKCPALAGLVSSWLHALRFKQRLGGWADQ